MADRPEREVLIHEFVTGGGLAGQTIPPSWMREGRAMRRALAEDFASLPGVRVVMTLDASLPDEPGAWRVVRIRPGEEPATFAHLAASADLTLCVAPETGGVLEARAAMIERHGGRSLGSSPEAVALCGDKIRLGRHLASRGIPTPEPRRVVPADGLPADVSYPAVLKPIDGAGSLDTYLLRGPHDMPAGAVALPDALVQPFVAGDALSASFLFPIDGEPRWIGLGRQAVAVRDGRFSYEGGTVPELSSETCDRLRSCLETTLASIPGLRGWVGIDLIRDPATGAFSILEINPRVTTSYIGWRTLIRGRGTLARVWLGDPSEIVRDSGRRAWFSADGQVEVDSIEEPS